LKVKKKIRIYWETQITSHSSRGVSSIKVSGGVPLFHVKVRGRKEAGKKLAEELLEYRGKDNIVYAIPRGGVVTAYEIAKELGSPLDIIIPRKIGAPGNPELAVGAVTEDGTTILNNRLIAGLRISESYIESEKERQIEEIKRRVKAYRGEAPPKDLEGKTVILVDDGIATGATVRAAIHSIKRSRPSTLVVAVPVGPPDTIEELRGEVDRLVCLVSYEPFFAIGQFYEDFSQVEDKNVVNLLKRARKSER